MTEKPFGHCPLCGLILNEDTWADHIRACNEEHERQAIAEADRERLAALADSETRRRRW